MKTYTDLLVKNKVVVAGIFLAGALTALIVGNVNSQFRLNKASEPTATQAGYGALGYGRGKGMGGGSNGAGLNKENCLFDGCLAVEDAEYPVGELSQTSIGYLNAALADERKALATYNAAMDAFGKVRPFVNIARAEEQHISMLKALFDKYGVEIPEDKTVVGTLPKTLPEVCAVGVQAEIDNDQLYQSMIASVPEQDIKDIFTSLAAASLNMHLPAFERCAN